MANTTFNVTKRTTKIAVNKISQKTYNDKLIITGKLTDKTGTNIKNGIIKITYNGKTVNVKTNNKCVYTSKFTINKVGNNVVNIKYIGTSKLKSVNKKITFKSVAQKTKLTINKISNIKRGRTVKITGKLTNIKGKILKTSVKIKINSKTVKVKTNNKGVYTYNYKPYKRGTYKVTVSFIGTKNYKANNKVVTFKVY